MVQLQYGFLCLGYFVTGRYSATVQDTANLPELAYSRFNVTDPLGWDVLDALKLLSGFLQTSLVVTWQRVICVMDFASRCTAASLVGVGRSISKVYVVYRLMCRPKSSEHAADTRRVAAMAEKRHEEVSAHHWAG